MYTVRGSGPASEWHTAAGAGGGQSRSGGWPLSDRGRPAARATTGRCRAIGVSAKASLAARAIRCGPLRPLPPPAYVPYTHTLPRSRRPLPRQGCEWRGGLPQWNLTPSEALLPCSVRSRPYVSLPSTHPLIPPPVAAAHPPLGHCPRLLLPRLLLLPLLYFLHTHTRARAHAHARARTHAHGARAYTYTHRQGLSVARDRRRTTPAGATRKVLGKDPEKTRKRFGMRAVLRLGLPRPADSEYDRRLPLFERAAARRTADSFVATRGPRASAANRRRRCPASKPAQIRAPHLLGQTLFNTARVGPTRSRQRAGPRTRSPALS